MKYESIDLTDEERIKLPGQFIKLTHGYVHYELSGPASGETVVLIHGFSSPMLVWDNVFDFLVSKGFKVLRYDLYGRGYSDRPDLKYTMDLFVEQLHELVTKLDLTIKPFNIAGLSMGGGISVVFTDRYTDLVKKVVLVDPIGFPAGRRLLFLMLRIPVINRVLLRFFTIKMLVKGQRGDFYDESMFDDYIKKYVKQLVYRGYIRSIRSTLINTSFSNLRENYENLEKKKIPIQLFWGKEDRTIPYK
ncbi:MAG: alpha/beta hydrolase, partial [Candidatus Hodarchaeales archaeon]